MLVKSADALVRKAGQQVLHLLSIIESNMALRDRLLCHHEDRWVVDNGVRRKISIKIIQSLKDIANDGKYHTDAIRRIRSDLETPVDEYRVFFAPVELQPDGVRTVKILGVYHRSIAYQEQTMAALIKRYGE